MRPFEDAARWVAQLGLKSVRQWFHFARTEAKPNDIPTNPHRGIYRKNGTWLGWDVWLGRTPLGRLDLVSIGVTTFAFVREPGTPANLYTLITSPFGEKEIKSKLDNTELRVIRLYRVRDKVKHHFLGAIEKSKTSYFGEADKILISNPDEFFYALESLEAHLNEARREGDIPRKMD